MHTLRFIVAASCILILCSLYSCKKDSGISAHIITYKLTASNYTFFTNISYTDTLGVQSITSAEDSTAGWSKTIKDPYTSFTAILEVQGQNSSSATLSYTLEIDVDGTERAVQQFSTAAFGSFNNQVSAIIQ